MYKILLILFLLVIIGCGSVSKKTSSTSVSPSISSELQEQLDRIQPLLLTCDGGFTKDNPHTITGRPHCDTGDSILYTGLLSTVDPVKANTDYKSFIANSIDTNGQPFRSPEHLRACKLPENANNSSCNFSRDHILGIVLNSIATKDCTSLVKVFNYARANSGKFCAGTISQCSLSLASYDMIGDAYGMCGISRPLITIVSDPLAPYAEMITVETNDSFQLELAVDFIYVKYLTDNLTSEGQKVVNLAASKMPWNVYFLYVQSLISGTLDSQKDNLANQLLPIERQVVIPGKEWYWQWGDVSAASAWSMWFLDKLLLQ